MLEAALDCRLENLARRVSRIEERCQVQAEVFLQKSSTSEQLGAKLHEVSEALQQKADNKALENINRQLHMLRDVITEAVGQVQALSDQLAAQAELPRPSWCSRRARAKPPVKAKAAGSSAGATANLLMGTEAGALIEYLETHQAGPWGQWGAAQKAGSLQQLGTGRPDVGVGAQPRSAGPAAAPARAAPLKEASSQGAFERRYSGPEAPGEAHAAAAAAAAAAAVAVAPPAPLEAEGHELRPGESPDEALGDRSRDLPPEEVLAAVLAVERMCRQQLDQGGGTPVNSDLNVELLVDEPEVRYCMCSSLESPTVISVLCTSFPDIFLEDAVQALVSAEELDQWNAQGEFKVLEAPRKDDPLQEHVVHYVLKAPWPFWDRDVLQRRWRLPLPGEGGAGRGCAVVMRSVSSRGAGLMQEQSGVVRAFVYGASFLLRPMHEGRSKGTELTYLTQLDIGGLCPAWAQGLLMRIASRGVVEWSQKLSAHCASIRGRRPRGSDE